MPDSVGTRRGTTTSRTTRSSLGRTSIKRRHHRSSMPDDLLPVPDVDELRRLRQAHFDHIVSPKNSLSKQKKQDVVRRSRSRKSRGIDRKSSTGVRTGSSRTSEYVYATSAVPSDRELGPNHARHRSRDIDPSLVELSTIPEAEVTPDDSVSQLGTRKRRSRKIRSSLRPLSEYRVVPPHQSSILGSLLGRRNSTAAAVPTLVECLTCGADDIPIARSAKLECQHRMCHACLKRVFKLAVHDPAHMPPRCCTTRAIPLKHVDKLFDMRFKILFNKKHDEYRTKDRVYCPNKKCGIWIRPTYYHKSGGRRYAQCRRCQTRACLQCGLKLHKSSDCPKDPEMVSLAEQAEREGWKRCYSCNAMVELREGCNHMTCRCTAEFCMVCGAKWKTCDCAWFNTGALPLIDNADAIFDPFAFLQRHVLGQQNDPLAARAPAAPPLVRTYRQEMTQRERQERIDEDLARRMQLVGLWE